ncbi:MAG: glucose-1-phosphate cytidylyltransferase [Candidatus Glassbacteria bacterium RIFCSPLOWO2_12_FULL_58_11]|uniref:Glucose-1-phosphate cytidylyltransferase n=1 Tax=Candidatus Glassbacteria bacterium RIFCSPLOWO2_12_FULL_58_11 TaxID=1817867 RepID=A0A1F5YRV5_9BACT|nr:MAG: glucose-1-phosphate cytidylyltransferase [Candidatus Glassbacteria bacterium RIFCSPLOWO2_12_FULL_58_11]
MKAVILCGGKGTRIREVSEIMPKPMTAIGGKPILWHIMNIYASQGITDFLLCLGYKGWMIKEFFLNYRTMISDCSITLGRHAELEFHDEFPESSWRITLADTGENAMTGARLYRVRKYLEGCGPFCLTYGDGVADIDLRALVEQHERSGLAGTLTGIRMAGRFGELNITGGKVRKFQEKPALTQGRVNGGFMVFDNRRVWDYLDDREDLTLEEEPLRRMAEAGQLGVYEHDGYWQCMDTFREYNLLNEIWDSGKAPWKIWG